MNRSRHQLAAILAAFVTAVAAALAPTGSSLDLTWHTIDGGGGTATGGVLVLTGTIGQPDAGTMDGGPFTLAGGFWTHGAGGPPCPADLDGNGDVDFGDILAVLSVWGDCPGCPEDLDGSGVVDFADLLIVLSAWGLCP